MNMPEDQKKPDKFKQAQLSLGLRKQFFDAKFVYSQQQISNPDAFLIPIFKQLPSQIHGFTRNDIQVIHGFATQLLQEAAKSLNVPVCTLVLAQSIFHFFYSRKSFLDYDIRDIMMGAMYLACKSEETLRKSYEIAFVFDYLFKAYEGERKISVLEIKSTEYEHIKNTSIIGAQLDILFQLGFQVYRLFDIPHRYIGNFLTLFEKHPKYGNICQMSWKRLNDCYRTLACLYYPHHIIAAAAVHMGMRQCQASFPQIPWWSLLQAYEQAITHIEVMVKDLEQRKSQIKYSFVSDKINEVGNLNGIQNSFPIPYYRKIMLERRGKLRQSKQYQIKKEPTINELEGQRKKSKIEARDIVKVKGLQTSTRKQSQLQIENGEAQQEKGKEKDCQGTKNEKGNPINKFTIDKKNLLSSINSRLQKHEATLSKKNQSSSSQSEDEQIIAELRRKRQLNKQAQNNDKNK